MEVPVPNYPYRRPQSNNQDTIKMQPQTVIVSLFANVSSPKVVDPFPIMNLLNKFGDSCQTYINYYKTHTMATR